MKYLTILLLTAMVFGCTSHECNKCPECPEPDPKQVSFFVVPGENEVCIISIEIDSIDVVSDWNCTDMDKVDLIGDGKFIIRSGGLITFKNPE